MLTLKSNVSASRLDAIFSEGFLKLLTRCKPQYCGTKASETSDFNIMNEGFSRPRPYRLDNN